MIDLQNKKFVLPIHILVFSIAPILSLYADNVTQVAFSSTIRILVVTELLALICFGLLSVITRKPFRSAIIVSFGFVIYFLIIPLQSFFASTELKFLSRLRFLIPAAGIAFSASLWIILNKTKNLEGSTRYLNIVAIFLIFIPVAKICHSYLVVVNKPKSGSGLAYVANTVSGPSTSHLPDVYYIVLDTYGRSDQIKAHLGFDNSTLLEPLVNMGFYIAPCSNANYPSATWQSIHASLNMDYFDHEKLRNQDPNISLATGNDEIKHNDVLLRFKQMGYTFVNFNTLYDFLNFTNADYYYDFMYFPGTKINLPNPFEKFILTQTPIGSLDQLNKDHRIHFTNVMSVLNILPKIPNQVPSPKFVYVHIMAPHLPYDFSSDGMYLPDIEEAFSPQHYNEELKFIDKKIVQIVQAIIQDSAIPPVIILQGDHGFPSDDQESAAGILNAYYLPGKSGAAYPTISPVNTFRLVFRQYFGQELELLPDRTYFDNLGSDSTHRKTGMPYKFIEYEEQDICSSLK